MDAHDVTSEWSTNATAAETEIAPFDPDVIAEVLGEQLGGSWSVTRATHGGTGRSFVGSDGARRVFVKLDVRFDVLQRLAEIGVAPPLLHTGHHHGEWIAVQEFVDGPAPARSWFGGHLPELAQLFAAYHDDASLAAMLTPASGISYRGVVERTLADLGRLTGRLHSRPAATGGRRGAPRADGSAHARRPCPDARRPEPQELRPLGGPPVPGGLG